MRSCIKQCWSWVKHEIVHRLTVTCEVIARVKVSVRREECSVSMPPEDCVSPWPPLFIYPPAAHPIAPSRPRILILNFNLCFVIDIKQLSLSQRLGKLTNRLGLLPPLIYSCNVAKCLNESLLSKNDFLLCKIVQNFAFSKLVSVSCLA